MAGKNKSKRGLSYKEMPSKIKRYILIDHLATGGFGTVFRAITKKDISSRFVVIKMIKKRFSKDIKFRNSFLKEIKNSFPLTHPNIAQMYEYGEHEGQLFYVLEYIQGIDLRKFMKRAAKYKEKLPIPVILHIIIEASKGLHYAHTFNDPLTGKAKSLIHRDISPHNIMISYEGSVKIIDFGVAKTKTDMDQTQTGILKGKPAYMAPEYIRMKHYDHRFDQFSLAIIFWELITGKKLFKGESKLDIIKQLDKCEIPLPRFDREDLAPDIQEVIIKCLNKNHRLRFRSMDDVQNILTRLLYKNYPDFSPSDLQSCISKYFATDIKWDEAKLRKRTKLAQQKRLDELETKSILKKAR